MSLNSITHTEVHHESHHITNCMHEQHVSPNGGMSFKSQMQQSINEQPQTLEETLNELASYNRELDVKHKMFGTGNTIGNIVSDVTGEGEETVVMLMPDNMPDSSGNNSSTLQVSADMLNAIIMPRKDSLRKQLSTENNTNVNKVSTFDTASGSQLQKRRNGYIPFNAKGIKKRIRKWMQSLSIKLSENDMKRENKQKEMKVLSQEYILDSYDKNGQYHQLEKRGAICDNLNEKA